MHFPVNKIFLISLPSDRQGFVGRACSSPNCKQYFKIRAVDHKDALHCPYCGESFSEDSLVTREQLEHAKRIAVEEARVYAIDEIQKMLGNAFRGSPHITYTPGPRPTKRPVVPRYKEREVDTQLQCSECDTQFQVYGIFGYCPRCKCENLQIYDANWTIIKGRIASANNKTRELRHAYGDLISTFEFFCARKAKRLTTETENFQSLFDARKFFRKHANLDILASIPKPALLSLRRAFQKRHVCIHAGGVITDRYIRMIPEDKALLGKPVVLLESELDEAASAMRTALADLVRKTERSGK
jgi:Zn finger protein HypA/HybF involved in hydrogenase expression